MKKALSFLLCCAMLVTCITGQFAFTASAADNEVKHVSMDAHSYDEETGVYTATNGWLAIKCADGINPVSFVWTVDGGTTYYDGGAITEHREDQAVTDTVRGLGGNCIPAPKYVMTANIAENVAPGRYNLQVGVKLSDDSVAFWAASVMEVTVKAEDVIVEPDDPAIKEDSNGRKYITDKGVNYYLTETTVTDVIKGEGVVYCLLYTSDAADE